MERRLSHLRLERSSPLPVDYLRMVEQVFSVNFELGLKKIAKLQTKPRFEACGSIYPTEIVLCVSLTHEGALAATTVYASSDFDPKASSPTLQDILSWCVDAAGTVFGHLFDSKHPERIDQIANHSLSAMEHVPFEWAEVEVEKARLFVKLDKANPALESAADQWLMKHDPNSAERELEEQAQTEKLFISGPRKPEDPLADDVSNADDTDTDDGDEGPSTLNH